MYIKSHYSKAVNRNRNTHFI